MSNPTVVVVGAGPGVSGSVARRYARAGWDVGLVGLDPAALTTLGEELQQLGPQVGWADADVTDPDALAAAITRLAEHTGRVDVLHFNPSAFRGKTPLELTVEELLSDMRLGVGALLTSLQAARPFMGEGARITATGSAAADKPDPGAASLGVQKAGLRNLVRSIDKSLRDEGIRAATVTINGVLKPKDPASPFHPENVAAAIFDAAQQPADRWRDEVPYDG
jgi:NAD(P)-dependent dehydrogenase (short-subunit alcohol dehydrogenase family)